MKDKKIVILHGWQSQLQRWQPVKKELEHLGWQVFLPGLPGFGDSKIIKPWNLTNYVDWLREYLQKNKLSNYFLLGHSFGGQISLKFGSLKQQGLRGLILVNSAGIRKGMTLKKAIFYILAKSGKAFFNLPLFSVFRRPANNLLYKLAREQDYHLASSLMKETLRNVLKEDMTPLFHKINIPTLIVWGKQDKTTPLKDGLTMKKKIAKSKIIVYDDIGHGLPFTKTQALVKIIDNFYQNA